VNTDSISTLAIIKKKQIEITLTNSYMRESLFCCLWTKCGRDQIIELGKYDSNYMFMSEPSKSAQKQLDNSFSEELKKSINFIKEAYPSDQQGKRI
jgi:hypothetical protein